MLHTLPVHKNNFDFLRFLFASLVIFTHGYALSTGDITRDPIYPYTGRVLSELAVCCFFIISGFLVQQSLERSRSAGSFLRKRILRIFPGLVITILFTALVLGPLVSSLDVASYFSQRATWLYFVNILLVPQPYLPGVFEHNFETAVNGSLWTLRYELLFYLLLVLLYPVPARRQKYMVPALFLICMAACFVLKRLPPGVLPAERLFTYFFLLGTYFTGGATLSLWRDRIIRRKSLLLAAGLILFLAALLSRLPALELPGMAALIVLVIAAGLHYWPWLHFSRYTGDISYGTYIYAYPLQQSLLVWLPGLPFPLYLLCSLGLSWIAGALSWHLVEKRFLAVKRAQP